MRELMDEGYLKSDAAKRIGLLPGFKRVDNALARDLAKGIYPPGRRKKPR